jgi:hypothetical protein
VERRQGRAVQADPIKPTLKPTGNKRLKLKCDVRLSTSALKPNLRRYSKDSFLALRALIRSPGRVVHVDPMNSRPKLPGTKRLKVKCDLLLSTSAFKFNLRCYIPGRRGPGAWSCSPHLTPPPGWAVRFGPMFNPMFDSGLTALGFVSA